jgi:uncharacterized protein Yka (UPF0111/DUF47 family)
MMAKETTLGEIEDMLAHVVERMATKEDIVHLDTCIGDLRTEMIDQFEHVDKQFETTHEDIEWLEELGASNAGFSKEIDHLLTRVRAIERHLGIDKKVAA